MSYPTYVQGATMFPQLPDWAPNVNLTLSMCTSSTAYIDVTASWRGASKTWRWQLAGGSENMSLVRLGEVNMHQSEAGGPQMGYTAPGGGNEYTGNASASWYNAHGRAGTSTYQEYEPNNYDYTGGEVTAGGAGPQYRTAESSGPSSVPRYTGSEDLRPLEDNYHSGAATYDGGSYDSGTYDGGSYDSGSYSYREWKAGNKSKSRTYDNSGKRNAQGGEKGRKHLNQ